MTVPSLLEAALTAASGGSGPPLPSDYTYVTNLTSINNNFWFDATQTVDIGTPGPSNVVATWKAVVRVRTASPTAAHAMWCNRGGAGGFNVQVRVTSAGNFEARVFHEDNSGTNRISGFSALPGVSVGDIVTIHVVWDSAGCRVYTDGQDETSVLFTTGYGAFNGNGGFSWVGANISGYYDGSTSANREVEACDPVAVSIRQGVALSAAQVAADVAATSPSNLHLSLPTYAWRPDPADSTAMITDAGAVDLSFNTTDTLDPPVIATQTP